MNATRLIATVFAAAAISGGISVAVAQSAAPEPDSGAMQTQSKQVAAAPAAPSATDSNPGAAGTSAPAASSSSGSTEPAPQADRG